MLDVQKKGTVKHQSSLPCTVARDFQGVEWGENEQSLGDTLRRCATTGKGCSWFWWWSCSETITYRKGQNETLVVWEGKWLEVFVSAFDLGDVVGVQFGNNWTLKRSWWEDDHTERNLMILMLALQSKNTNSIAAWSDGVGWGGTPGRKAFNTFNAGTSVCSWPGDGSLVNCQACEVRDGSERLLIIAV